MAEDLCLAFFCLGGGREERNITKKIMVFQTTFHLVSELVSECYLTLAYSSMNTCVPPHLMGETAEQERLLLNARKKLVDSVNYCNALISTDNL